MKDSKFYSEPESSSPSQSCGPNLKAGFLPYSRQCISSQDIDAVVSVLESDWLTTGPTVRKFEEAFADRCGARHAIAVSSGTAALHLALMVAGVEKNDRVWTTPNTFVASANAAAFLGAIPDFCDIDPINRNLCPTQLRECLKLHPESKAVVAVHHGGPTADLKSIHEVADRTGAIVIEDSCHAVGGRFLADGQRHQVGGNPYRQLSTFSFHPVKTMTSAEGGMITTDDDGLADRCRKLRSHGIERDHANFVGLTGVDARGFGGSEAFGAATSMTGPWSYEMHELGFNYRLSDVHASLGLSQLRRLDSSLSRRRELVEAYREALIDCPHIRLPAVSRWESPSDVSWHLFSVEINFEALNMTRGGLVSSLAAEGIGTQVHYIPVHLQPFYRRKHGYQAGKCPNAESYYNGALSLPLYSQLKTSDVQRVARTVRDLIVASVQA